MTYKERARKWLTGFFAFEGNTQSAVEALAAQFAESCESWMHSVENLRRLTRDNKARIAALEAALRTMIVAHDASRYVSSPQQIEARNAANDLLSQAAHTKVKP